MPSVPTPTLTDLRPWPGAVPALVVTVFETSIQAGFPSPAEEVGAKRIDLTTHLVHHPQATFYVRVRGDAMRDEGIFDGDTLLVDRALVHRHGQIVVAVVEGEMVCRRLAMTGRARLKTANPGHPDTPLRPGIEIWGVVTTVIRRLAT